MIRHFEETSELTSLGRELEQIPRNTLFYSRWQDYLGRKGLEQQENLFNAQPNLGKLIELKSELLSRSKRLQPSLTAAYQLIESFEGRLQKMKDKTEYELISTTGSELNEIRILLKEASAVRKTLCSALRSEKYTVLEELKGKSFRHTFCAAAMQAMLTDSDREVTSKENDIKVGGCPDWTRVLNGLFPKAELDNAIKKPYAHQNLPVLQRLLSTINTAQNMAIYGMEKAWETDLEKTIHKHTDLHRYQSALARNKKMCEQYHLEFDPDGLVF